MCLLQLIVMLAHFHVFIIGITTADLLPSSSSKNTLKAVRGSLEEVDVHSMWPSGGDDSASSLLI